MVFPLYLRRWLWPGLLLGGLIATLLLARFWLGGFAVRRVLEMAGATHVEWNAVRATPWHVEIDGLSFVLQSQALTAEHVVLERARWWTWSLGDIRVRGLRWPVHLVPSSGDAWQWSRYEHGLDGGEVTLPFASLDLRGQIVVEMNALPSRPIDLVVQGKSRDEGSWLGTLEAVGDGFRLRGGGALLRAGQELEFQVKDAELDLGRWAHQVQRLVSLPGAPWEISGKLNGSGEGRVTAKRFAATASISLREGAMRAGTQDIAAQGAEAEIEFSDLWKFRSKSGALRLRQLRTGELVFHDLSADFGLWDGKMVRVTKTNFAVLGGFGETAPIEFDLEDRRLAVSLRLRDLDAARTLALAPSSQVAVQGRLDGELTLQIDPNGVRFRPGRVAMQPGGVLEFDASALLRSGMRLDAQTTNLLKQIAEKSPRVRLQAENATLLIRPPDATLGSSARASIAGEVDGEKIAFDYSINGALERRLSVLSPRRSGR